MFLSEDLAKINPKGVVPFSISVNKTLHSFMSYLVVRNYRDHTTQEYIITHDDADAEVLFIKLRILFDG